MRVCFLLRGGISKKNVPHQMNYVNFRACFNSIQKYIVDVNKNCTFDFFIHCWSKDLSLDLISLYQPKKYQFEDNNLYSNTIRSIQNKYHLTDQQSYNQISSSLSLKKSIELMESYSAENKIVYDYVIIYRPDILIWKEMDLSIYSRDIIYVNKWYDAIGDFHFVMNMDHANKFKNLFDSCSEGNNKPMVHVWIKNYIVNYLKIQLEEDNIRAGFDQEVLRQLYLCSYSVGKILEKQMNELGLTLADIM